MAATVTDERRNLTELRPDERNARTHSPAQVQQIAASIREFGFVAPVVIRPDGRIIGGHATIEACRQLQHADAPCRVVAGLTDDQYTLLALALNRLPERSDW